MRSPRTSRSITSRARSTPPSWMQAGGRPALQARDRGRDHPQAQVRQPPARAARTGWRWRSPTRSARTRSRCTSTSSTTRPRRTTPSRSRSSIVPEASTADSQIDGLMLDLAQIDRLRRGGAEGLRALPAGRGGRQRRRRAPPGGGDGGLRRRAYGRAVVRGGRPRRTGRQAGGRPEVVGIDRHVGAGRYPAAADLRAGAPGRAGRRRATALRGRRPVRCGDAKLTGELGRQRPARTSSSAFPSRITPRARSPTKKVAKSHRHRERGRGRRAEHRRAARRELRPAPASGASAVAGHVPRHVRAPRRRAADGHVGTSATAARPPRARRSRTRSTPARSRSPRPSSTASRPRPRRARRGDAAQRQPHRPDHPHPGRGRCAAVRQLRRLDLDRRRRRSWPTSGRSATVGPPQGETAYARLRDARTYTVKLTVTDDGGRTGVAVATVVVREPSPNRPPVAVADQLTTRQDTERTIDVLADEATGGAARRRSWTPGRRRTGRPRAPSWGAARTRRPRAMRASDAFTYVVEDPAGGRATGQVTVTVNDVNDPPTAEAGADQDVLEDDGVFLDAQGLGRSGRIDRSLHMGLRRRKRPGDGVSPATGPRLRRCMAATRCGSS